MSTAVDATEDDDRRTDPMKFSQQPDRLQSVVASAASPTYYEPTIDVGGAPINVPAKRLQMAIAENRFPFARSAGFESLATWGSVADFLNEYVGAIQFEAQSKRNRSLVTANDEAIIACELDERYQEWTVTVAAVDRPMATKYMEAIAALLPSIPPPPPPEPLPYNIVPVRFFMQDPYSKEAYSRRRNITVHSWDEVSANYAASARAELESLMKTPEPAGGKLVLMHGSPGGGKAQPHDAKILTPNGWTTMGEIQPDDMVCSPNGGWARVKAKYPQGEVPIYRVTFSDGTSTRCCGDHLWAYRTRNDRRKKTGTPPDQWRVKSLLGLQPFLQDKDGAKNAWIPLVTQIDFADQGPLPIDPYVLGVLIGDGYLRSKSDVSFTKPDVWMADELKSAIGEENVTPVNIGPGHTCPTWKVHGLSDDLEALGLLGKRSLEKFIPARYLTASVKDRQALLAGLLDTDGHAKDHTCEYATSSPQLAKDVGFLLWSLGCTFAENVRVPHYTHNDEYLEGAPSHRFYVCAPEGFNPFRMPRKADAFTPRSKYPPRRSMVSIEYDGIEEASCIALDSVDHLYVTDDFIVTHNTRAILTLISEWREWCAASVITDADRFFNDPTYMNSLVFNAEGMADWLMLVIEDADEFINVRGRETKGQSIARLLNLADGIVGQGLNLLTLMSTNVAVDELNPAITRNGRCMANVHVGAFEPAEATTWLADRGRENVTFDEPVMLADLYANLNAT